MAIDMFLKLSGISGDSTDPTYPGWISVLAWSWGESNSGVAGGHANFEDLSLTKYVDTASLPLMGHCAAGTLITSATLVNRDASTGVVSFKIALTNVTVSSVSDGGSGGESRLTEQVSLSYQGGTIRWTYTYLNSVGQPVSKTQGWDLVNGVPL